MNNNGLSNAAFIYVVYLDMLSDEFLDQEEGVKKDSEYIYDILTNGLLLKRGNPEPVVLSESLVAKYGIDNLISNLQRKFRHNFHVVVCKVPQEFMRQEYSYGRTTTEEKIAETNKFRALPLLSRKNSENGLYYFLAPQYIESVYLGNNGNYGRVLNENWQPVIQDSLGMFFDPSQKRRFKINNDWEILEKEAKKLAYCKENNLTSEQLSFIMKCNPELMVEFGNNQPIVEELQTKYKSGERILKRQMSLKRIETLLLSDTGKSQHEKRQSFIKEQI